MKKISIIFMIVLLSVNAFSGIRRKQTEPEAGISIGRQIGIFIGIDKYKEWPSLGKAVDEVKEIRKAAMTNYYFDESIELYNREATAENILKVMEKTLTSINEDDSVIIVYAGHGDKDDVSGTYYWVPNDAGISRYAKSNWISMDNISGYLSNMKAKHILIIADTCYSGEMVEVKRGKPETIDNDFVKKAYLKKSRQAIVSGNRDVSDKNPFGKAVSEALYKNQQKYLETAGIYENIKNEGLQGAMAGNIDGTGHEAGGSFIMFLKPVEERKEVKSEEPQKDYNYFFIEPKAVGILEGEPKELKLGWECEAGLKLRDKKLIYEGALFIGENKEKKFIIGANGGISYDIIKQENVYDIYMGAGANVKFIENSVNPDIYINIGGDITTNDYLIGLNIKTNPASKIPWIEAGVRFGFGWE